MKKTKIIIILIITSILIVIGSILLMKNNNVPNNIEQTDAIKFKKEYESLNNTIRESDGATYNNVTISEENPIVYIDTKKALELLESDKAIIYIGANWCPWCRNAVPVMLDVAVNLNVDKIYYLNLDNEKSNFKIENKTLIEINHGTEDYYKLLDALKDYLSDYILKDEDGNSYNTNEKRIYMPYVITIKDGQIISEVVSPIKLEENQSKYDQLTKNQYNELYEIYFNMFKELYYPENMCDTDEKCS